ncbi:MAG TPA: hypothetical protein VK540_28320 [Polyangiaceae bacterium]|jgi:hypothetical protein|nr:hypothetical protein [Polyangiaceae bacterium]
MNQKTWAVVVIFAVSLLSLGCQSGGIGDPCVPEDEYQQYFSGYSETEVNLESRSFQCETRLCLVNHFRGRVTCPYGQDEEDKSPEEQRCHVPGTTGSENLIKVPVNTQYEKRSPADSVYCSCRCAGPDSEGRYCKCPTGFQCVRLLDYVPRLGSKELAGSYCVKDGTEFTEKTNLGSSCIPTNPDAVPPEPPGACGFYNGPI